MEKCSFKPKTLNKDIESQNYFDEELYLDVKKPYSMPAKKLGKHRTFELYSLAKPKS
jgi:hypothetical protein